MNRFNIGLRLDRTHPYMGTLTASGPFKPKMLTVFETVLGITKRIRVKEQLIANDLVNSLCFLI